MSLTRKELLAAARCARKYPKLHGYRYLQDDFFHTTDADPSLESSAEYEIAIKAHLQAAVKYG